MFCQIMYRYTLKKNTKYETLYIEEKIQNHTLSSWIRILPNVPIEI